MNPDGDRGQCVRSADPCTTVFGYLNTEKEPARYGNTHPSIVPYQLFNSIDGHIAVGNDEQFRRFCRVIGPPALADVARSVANQGRTEHRTELLPILEEYRPGNGGQRAGSGWTSSCRSAILPTRPWQAKAAVPWRCHADTSSSRST
jgi:crotonobetainyl-CoA:carnitine CoA-transferase CaiB-like acyl-CoA transferase